MNLSFFYLELVAMNKIGVFALGVSATCMVYTFINTRNIHKQLDRQIKEMKLVDELKRNINTTFYQTSMDKKALQNTN